jgi:hypothetical protein
MNDALSAGLIALDLPVPPMLEMALRYDGPARWVGFFWSPFGDEVCWSDGRFELRADWYAWRVFTEHTTVMAALASYDFGSSATVGTHVLLLDRGDRRLSVAPTAAARAFLDAQWTPRGDLPAAELPPTAELGELTAEAAAFQLVAPLPDLAAQVVARMQRAAATCAALQAWLSTFMPPPDPTAQRAMIEATLAELLGRSERKR